MLLLWLLLLAELLLSAGLLESLMRTKSQIEFFFCQYLNLYSKIVKNNVATRNFYLQFRVLFASFV